MPNYTPEQWAVRGYTMEQINNITAHGFPLPEDPRPGYGFNNPDNPLEYGPPPAPAPKPPPAPYSGPMPASGLMINTTKGEIPAWTAIPDMKGVYTMNNSPSMGTSAGPSISGVRLPASGHMQEYKITGWRYTSIGEVPVYSYKYQDPTGTEVWVRRDQLQPTLGYSVGDPKFVSIVEKQNLVPVNWTEDSYLAYIGISPDQIQDNLINKYSFQYSPQIINSVIGETDKIPGQYGLVDKSGNLIEPIASQPVYGSGVWTAQAEHALQGVAPATPGSGDIREYLSDPRTSPEKVASITGVPIKETISDTKIIAPKPGIPGEWPISVQTALVPTESTLATRIAQNTGGMSQIKTELQPISPVEQLVGDQNYYQTKDNQFILKSDFDKISPKYQDILKNQGWDAYQTSVATDFIKLPDNQLIAKTAYNQLDPRYQAILQSGGMDAYTKAIDMEYAKIPSAAGFVLVSRTDIAQLPVTQQYIFKKEGYEGLAKFVTENQQRLKGFTYVDSEGRANIDILTAMRSGEDATIKNLYTEKQIQEATSGKVIAPKLDTSGNILQTAESVGHYIMDELTIAGESLASPAVVAKMASGYVQVYDLAKDKLLASTVGIRDNELNKAIESNKDYQAFNKVVQTEVNAGLDGITRYADTFALPLISKWGTGVKQWVEEAPEWGKPQRAIASAIVDKFGLIPAMMAATLTSAAAHGGLGQEQKASEMVTGLGVGAASWFLTRPAAIATNPLIEGPYTVAMFTSPEKMVAVAKSALVKILPFPQKGTSIEAMGIDPTDVARVNTPAGVSPAEARQVLEVIEHNSAKMLGANVLPKILGETRDQVNVTTDNGLAKGNLMVSGLQRSVPNLMHHASGGEFHEALVKDLNTKGYFEVTAIDRGRGSVEFGSPQLAGGFLKENPAILNGLWSVKDLMKFPESIAKDLGSVATMKEARDKFYQYAYEGKLEKGIYPLVKWYGDKATLEYELMATPDFKWNATEAPWYARQQGINTATTFTTSPISYPEMGIKEGQKVPMYWVVSDNAKAEGRTMPSLKDLYRAEVYSTITDLRKALPQNIKMRDITLSEEGPASSTMITSKLKAVAIKGPEWAKDINQVIDRVNSGQLEPYYRQRATAIVVDQNGKMVAVQERNGNWSLPGGKIEGGSSIETILRELKEETGIKNPYRYERIGTIKDTVPLTSDQGGILWRDGKPVYNEHHVYLVKISRSDKPIPKGEIKNTAKVDWQNGLRLKKTESFVKSVLNMVDEQTMRDFLEERRGSKVSGAAVDNAQATGEWNRSKVKNTEISDDGKVLPYRIKIKPQIEGIEPVAAEITTMVEPKIFTSYVDSVKVSSDLKEYTGIKEKSVEGKIYPTITDEKGVTPETIPYGTPGKYNPPYSPPTVYNPLDTIPSKYTPPYTPPGQYSPPYSPPTQYNPPYSPPTVYNPPYTPPPKYPPVVPPPPPKPPIYPPPPIIPPPVIPIPPITTIKTKHGERAATQEQLEGAIAWKQGIMYITWLKPYNQSDLLYTRKPIPQVKYFTGPGSAAKSIVTMFGEVPNFLHADMGVVDVTVKGQGAAQPILSFHEDKNVVRKKSRKSNRAGIWSMPSGRLYQ
jgi:hypothetical protein